MQPHLKNDLLYLLRMLEAVEKINLYSLAFSDPLVFFDANDGKEFNACLMLLTQLGEQAGKISKELKERHKAINWNEIKSFRNRAVHDYTGLDRFLTFEIIKEHVPLLKQSVSKILSFELREGNFDKDEFAIAQTSPYLKHVDFHYILTGNSIP
jgi:uncharacterized protein with HEPN domain